MATGSTIGIIVICLILGRWQRALAKREADLVDREHRLILREAQFPRRTYSEAP